MIANELIHAFSMSQKFLLIWLISIYLADGKSHFKIMTQVSIMVFNAIACKLRNDSLIALSSFNTSSNAVKCVVH